MSQLLPDYKLLYEESRKKLAETVQLLAETEQKLALALLEINGLRAQLFGSRSDQRVKKATNGEVDILPLGALAEDLAASEALLKGEVALVEQQQQKKERKPHVWLPVWCCLPI